MEGPVRQGGVYQSGEFAPIYAQFSSTALNAQLGNLLREHAHRCRARIKDPQRAGAQQRAVIAKARSWDSICAARSGSSTHRQDASPACV